MGAGGANGDGNGSSRPVASEQEQAEVRPVAGKVISRACSWYAGGDSSDRSDMQGAARQPTMRCRTGLGEHPIQPEVCPEEVVKANGASTHRGAPPPPKLTFP